MPEGSGTGIRPSAPSWDGKWLSVLLRGAGLPRHALRLRDSDGECRSEAEAILRSFVPPADLEAAVARAIAVADERPADWSPAHRALADAIDERSHWPESAARPTGGSTGSKSVSLRCLLQHCPEQWPLELYWDAAKQENEIGRAQCITAAFNRIVRQLRRAGKYKEVSP